MVEQSLSNLIVRLTLFQCQQTIQRDFLQLCHICGKTCPGMIWMMSLEVHLDMYSI